MTMAKWLTGVLMISLSLLMSGVVLAAPEVSLTARTQGDTGLRDGARVAEGKVLVREAHTGVRVWLEAVKSGDAPARYVLTGRHRPGHQLRVRLQVGDAEPDHRVGQGLILHTPEPQVRYEVVADGDQKVAADEYGLTVHAAALTE